MSSSAAPGATQNDEPPADLGAEGDTSTERGSGAGTGDEDVSGLKAKNRELLGKLKSLTAEKQKREQADLEAKGEYEKLNAQLREENEALKKQAGFWTTHLEGERAELENLHKQLKKEDRELFTHLEAISEPEQLRRTQKLMQRLIGDTKGDEKPAKPPVTAPTVTAPAGQNGLTYSEMTVAQRVAAERKKQQGAARNLWPD